MLTNKKKIKEVEENLKKVKEEKQELLKLKEILENNYPKINISDLYVFSVDGINYIVKMQIVEEIGESKYYGIEVIGHRSTLIDIFSNKIIYEKFSISLIDREEKLQNKYKFFMKDDYGYLTPIIEIEKELLIYADRLVPTYVLWQLYYKLNNIDLNSNLLIKKKN